MLTTYNHEQLNDLVNIVLVELDALFERKDFHDNALKDMLSVIHVLKSSTDVMTKRAFLLSSLTLSSRLQQHVYKEADDCVDVDVAFSCNRVLQKYTRLYIDFAIDEQQFVAKVLLSQCVA
jgi:hypothetical protein